MLRFAPLPLLYSLDVPGVMKISVPLEAGQRTLAACRDLTLLIMIFYALAHPTLGMHVTKGARVEKEQYFWRDGNASARVGVLREIAPGVVNFFFVAIDPTFNIDLAMDRIIKEKRAASRSEWRVRMDAVTSQAYYVENVLGIKDPRCVLMELHDAANPASLRKFLSVEAPSFPGGAEVILPLMQHPNVILHLALFKDVAWHRGLSPRELERHVTRELWAARDDRVPEEVEDALEAVRRLNEESAAGGWDAFRASKLCRERTASLMLPWAQISPTLKLVLQWGQANPVRSAWTASGFAQMAQRVLDVLEQDFQVALLHEEIFLVLAARLGVFEQSYSLKLHMLFSGPPASSKSFILEMLKRLSIPGSTQAVSYETKRANATETDQNATVLTHDEVKRDLFKSGTGDAELKERLSSGRSTSRVFSQEHGRRKMRVVESKQQCMFIGCTNESFCDLPEAVHSRFFCREVPKWPVRAGKELVDLLAKGADLEKQEAFAREMRGVQFKAAVVFTRIYVGDLAPVDMATAYRVFARAQTLLKKRGCDILPRSMQRLLLMAQSLTVWCAVEMGAPLACTEEIAVFCLTQEAVSFADVRGFTFGMQIDEYLVVEKPKMIAAVAQLLSGRTMILAGGVCFPVMRENPARVLRAYKEQSPLAVLVEVIEEIAQPGWLMGMTRRREGRPEVWRRVG
jgi:hypothetical protein